MRILNGIAIAAIVAVLASTCAPAYAACSGSPLLATADNDNKSFIWTQDVFVPYYIGVPGYIIWGEDAGIPPVTSAFSGVFWALGTGDPATSLGDDNGTHTEGGWFHYYTWPSTAFYTAGYIDTTWAVAGVDGCLYNSGASGSLDGDECTCVLLSDQDGTQGYFAIASGQVDVVGNTILDMPGADGNGNSGPIILMPIPKPFITFTQVESGTLDIDLSVTVAPFSAGVYAKDGCDCGPIGFKVMSIITARGDPPPADRDAALWTEIELSTGGAQPVTSFGSSVTIKSTCGSANTDVYLATGLVFDSGFGPTVVSKNSTRIECGPTVAEPWELGARPDIPRSLRSPVRHESDRSGTERRTRSR
jgi:hypothetical protein